MKDEFLNPRVIWRYIRKKLYIRWLQSRKNIVLEGPLMIRGKPLIDIGSRARLELGSNVTLRSSNTGYHINMYSSVKLLAEEDGALIKIGRNSRINGSCIHAKKSVIIGSNCLIAANCQIFDNNGHALSFNDVKGRINTRDDAKSIIIEDNVWIGTGSVILPGVKIGMGTVIGANSVVVRDIPPMVIAAGNPAVVVKNYSQSQLEQVFIK